MKEKILALLREMTNDSKSVSYKAEKEICAILTEVINKLHTIEKNVGWYVRDYPDKIYNIENPCCNKLPKEIECNEGDFCFETEWLDINLQEYFENLKRKKIYSIKNGIAATKNHLKSQREDLKKYCELNFEDL